MNDLNILMEQKQSAESLKSNLETDELYSGHDANYKYAS